MATTTIKVDPVVRDRLSCVAQSRGMTMSALLDVESRRLDAERRWAEIEAAYERLQREDPAAWQDYLDELTDVTVGEPDTTAAREWPEYNQ